MRLLFLTNFYPPFARGGYEQWCHDVAVELAGRKHQVCVLTSCSPNGVEVSTYDNIQVCRFLHPEVENGLLHTAVRLLRDRKRLDQEDLNRVRNVITKFQPEVALIWGMWNIPRSVPALVEDLLPGRVAYYLCDYWLSLPNAYIQRWQEPSRSTFAQWPKQLLGKLFLAQLEKEAPISLKLEHPICVSRAVRRLLVDAGVSINHAKIIYGGTRIEEFSATTIDNSQPCSQNRLKLLFVGRLDVEKGIHTSIRAMELLPEKCSLHITLDIVGKGHPDYEAELKALVHQYQLSQKVSFRGSVSRTEIPIVLAQYDALIFSSEWEEPFARTVLEALAAGLVVIGTTTGGTGEVLVEGKTGLTFSAGDAKALSRQICRLSDDLALRQQLARSGQQCVVENFTLQNMVDQIEVALRDISLSPANGT